MRLDISDWLAGITLIVLLAVTFVPNFLSTTALVNVGKFAGNLEQKSTPPAVVVDADELTKVARLVADKYAAENKLEIFSATPVNVVEDGKLEPAVEVVFAGNAPRVYCFSDGHCRRPGTW